MTVPGSKSSSGGPSGEEAGGRLVRHNRHLQEGGGGGGMPRRVAKKFTGLYTGPYFDPKIPTNLTAQAGDTALIPCTVNQIGRKTVSITRK